MKAELLDHRGRPRIVVTGMGIKCPAGTDVESMWTTMRAGQSMAGPIELFDASDLEVRFACETRNFDPVPYFGPKDVRRQDRVTHLGYAAAADAIESAGELGADPEQCAVVAAMTAHRPGSAPSSPASSSASAAAAKPSCETRSWRRASFAPK